MLRLLLFAIIMLALSAICNGQGVSNFGATRAQDTSKTKGQLVLPAYAGDSLVLLTTANGTVKGVSKDILGGAVDSSLYVTVTRLNDTLQSYQNIVNVCSLGATPYYIDSTDDDTEPIQDAINQSLGFVELSFDTSTQIAVIKQIDLHANAQVYVPNGEYHIRRKLVKYAYCIDYDGDTTFRGVNAQLYIPYQEIVSGGGSLPNKTMTIRGENVPNYTMGYLNNGYEYLFKDAPIFHSTINTDSSYQPALIRVIPGDTITPFALPITPSGTEIRIENMWIRVHHNPNNGGVQLCGIDLFSATNQSLLNVRIDSDTSNFLTTQPFFHYYGLQTAATGTGAIMNYTIGLVGGGFYYGVVLAEHTSLADVFIEGTKYPLEIGTSGYSAFLNNVGLHGNNYILHTGDFNLVPTGKVKIYGNLDVESFRAVLPSAWQNSNNNFVDISDINNLFRGEVYIDFSPDGVPSPNSLRFNGGKGLVVRTSAEDTNLLTGFNNNYDGTFGPRFISRQPVAGGVTISNNTTTGQGLIVVEGDRQSALTGGPTAAYGAIITGSSGNTASLGGGSKADAVYFVADGPNLRNAYYGTLTSDTAFVVTNNFRRAYYDPAGVFHTLGLDVYETNMGGSFTARTKVDKGYVDSSLALKGTVTSVSATDGNGFDFTVTNPTTTPTIGLNLQSGYALLNSNSAQTVPGAKDFTGTTTISTTTLDPLTVSGNVNSRGGIIVRNVNSGTGAAANFYFDASANFTNYGGLFKGGTGRTGTSLGSADANWTVLLDDGTANAGIKIVSKTADPVLFGTTDALRFSIKANGVLNIAAVSTYADNAAALAGGLVAGDIYRTSTGVMMIVF